MEKNLEQIVQLKSLVLIHQRIPARQIGRHQHDEHEIFLPIQGSIEVDFSGKKSSASPGRMLYVPPKKEHSFSASGQNYGERLILLVSDARWKKAGGRAFEATSIPTHGLVRELMFYLFSNRAHKNAEVFITALLETLISQISEFESSASALSFAELKKNARDERVKRSLELAESDPEATVPQLAKRAGMSPRNFQRLFQRELGLNPKGLLLRNKIERAETMLKSSGLSITEIAMEVGYSSLSKFIAAFQQQTGKVPSEYRKSL